MATSIQTAEAEEEAPRLFISYARTEHARVSQLAAALERGGYRVWWDAALQGGHHFAAEIDRELKAADAVVVVWTKDAIGSHWVLDEASAGRDRNCLVPVRFDETDPPLGFRQ
ncbi:MAG: toll/interleukin-1 receptor domain-containing protein, partial [Sandaracinobacteroides sp.]